ncbi:MAG: hypothetical protein WBF47_13875 [Xanthobacteraceae bacterium]
MQPTSARDRNIGDAHDRLRPEGKSVATTILIALVICMFLSKLHGNQSPKSMELDARAVRIVDPAFCKDQTWPYIDQHCLRRIDASDGTANNESAGSPATNFQPNVALSGMPTSVPGTVNVSSNAVTPETPSQAVAPQPITPRTPSQAGLAPTVVVQPAPPVTSTLTGEPPEVRENNADAAMAAPLNRQMEDASQHHPRPHGRRHAQFIFGFRF